MDLPKNKRSSNIVRRIERVGHETQEGFATEYKETAIKFQKTIKSDG